MHILLIIAFYHKYIMILRSNFLYRFNLYSNQLKKNYATKDVLFDNFGRFHSYLRVSLIEKCNLRCQYCMPEEGVQLSPKQSLMSLNDMKRVIKIFADLGINKIRFTGGEPTLSKDLKEIIRYSKSLNEKCIKSVGITTNGTLLSAQLLDGLIESGLTSINISLDTLQPDKFAEITRRNKSGILKVFSLINACIARNMPVKINCVLIRGVNDNEIVDFAKLTQDNKVDVRFIELMPFDGNDWHQDKLIGYIEAKDILKRNQLIIVKDLEKVDKHDTTKWYTIQSGSGSGQGRIGFITSMSNHFCNSCNRLRITADGKLKICLFGDESLSLKDCIRNGLTDEAIIQLIGDTIRKKDAVLGGKTSLELLAKSINRPMILIGG